MAKITVLTGGTTPERSVALAGAGQVVHALRRRGHHVVAVDTVAGPLDEAGEQEQLGSSVGAEPPSAAELGQLREQERLHRLLDLEEIVTAEAVFLVLHGSQGEGGQVQSLLESGGVAFTGSDALGSQLAMSKDVAKLLLQDSGVTVARGHLWPVGDDELAQLGEPPWIVKPSRVGSTVGLTLVERREELDRAVGLALQFDTDVLLETFLPGRELTIGILESSDGAPQPLGVGEIVAGRVFDFETKYKPGAAEEIFPADIDETLREELEVQAVRAHEALKLRHFSRVDFRLDGSGRPVCLEVNTLPGMTETSLLPQSAAAKGIGFDELCDRMVQRALRS